MRQSDTTDDLNVSVADFLRLWAWVILFTLFSEFEWLRDPLSIYGITSFLCLATALSLAFFRVSLGRVVLLIVVFSLLICLDLPSVPNHRYVICFFHALFLSGLLRDYLLGRSLGSALFRETRSFSVLLLLLVYGFAFFAKLNSSFLSVTESCALKFYGNIERFIPFLPSGELLAPGLIYSVLVVEGVLLLLLSISRFRTAGVVLGLLFHFLLSWDLEQYFINFSAVMSALLLLVLPYDFFAVLRSADSGRWQEKQVPFVRWVLGLLCLCLLISAIAYTAGIPTDVFWYRAWFLLALAVWLVVMSPIWLHLFWSLIPNSKITGGAGVDRPSSRLSCIPEICILGLVVLNGLSPYFGVKTRTAFSMYSNLRVEPNYSNHLLVDRSLDLLSLLKDQVQLESNRIALCNGRLWGQARYPYVEIASAALVCPEEEIAFRRNGESQVISGRADEQRIKTEIPWIQRKLLLFRPLDTMASTKCIW